jgi:hypothetical protein
VEAFAARLSAFVEANPVERLILDLRLNRGGDGGLNRPLLLAIIRSKKIDQKGRLFTIVGRSTWSAAQGLSFFAAPAAGTNRGPRGFAKILP